MKTIISQILHGAMLLTILVSIPSCSPKSGPNDDASRFNERAVVSDGGTKITFPKGYPGLAELTSIPAQKKAVLVSVFAPARVVASIEHADGDKTILFDSPDVTSLYSQYRQAVSNVELTSKNLGRLKDMFDNHAATARDLSQAETDAANAKAARSEYESKLRAAGFDPEKLGRVPPGTIWIISDVPETELSEVQNGEDVDIFFTSYPDRKFIGKEEAIGEVVDPVTRTVKVRVSMSDPQGKFLPGMFARVDFGDPVDGVIPLPSSSIVTVEGKDYAFVQASPEEIVRRQVTVVNTPDGQVIVRNGIQSGELVVTRGAILLKGLSFGF
jgi:membrane fusion protein, heavy metal efflux system